VAAVVVVAVIGGAAWLLRGPTPVAAATISHVQLAWHQNVELSCLGMEAVDNGGFDRAAIDIWGPNADGYVRADITAPDGTVERVIEQFDQAAMPIQAWSTSQTMESTVFRVADCTTRTQDARASYGVASPPHTPAGVPGLLFLTRSGGPLAERLDQSVESRRQLAATTRSDSFEGTSVTVYVVEESDSGVYDLGEGSRRFELWIDEVTGQVVRSVEVMDSEILGSATTALELVTVELVSSAGVDFTTDDLTQTLDRRSQESETDAVSTTTSIVPAAHPFMEDAVAINPAEIPTEDLTDVIGARAGDTLYRVPFDRDVAIIVRLRPGARPHVYATACALLLEAGLPDSGWDGTCMEVTIDGERITGPYSYAEARQLMPRR
jgi:hypothetical protein